MMQPQISTEQRLPMQQDPQVMSGAIVFTGTRVPVQTLFDYLLDGYSVHEFLDQFPSVTQEQVHQVLRFAQTHLTLGVAAS